MMMIDDDDDDDVGMYIVTVPFQSCLCSRLVVGLLSGVLLWIV